jgi:hypothetical protein
MPGVLDFARTFPQISQREPAPSDRDPIPAPFDNSYNQPERNDFHYKIKYHRDDAFLVKNILDDATRKRLDEAWFDLLGSFEYHDAWLRFVAKKYGIDLAGRSVRNLKPDWIAKLAPEPRRYVQWLKRSDDGVQQALAAAEPRHVDDVVAFARRAWRHPLDERDERRLRSYYTKLRSDEGLDHRQAIRTLLVRVLVSPEFLYRSEESSPGGPVVPLSDWELANRLSYFLWSSAPDAQLRRAAAAGELDNPRELVRQAKRMLRDVKARRFAEEFFGQWFGFYRFDGYRGVDPKRFPQFYDHLKGEMHAEAVAFFGHIIRQDRPVREILFADYAFVTPALAKHYGIEENVAQSTEPQRVEHVDRYRRGGLFGLGAVLASTSAPLRTSPVKRGDWILRRVLGTPVPPPPANAGSIAADEKNAAGLTVRAQLEIHRDKAACRNCHSRIDPLGFALENYNAIGRWRERYRDGQRIDNSGTLADGTVISGPQGLRRYLADNEKLFHRTLSTKLLGYALGRSEQLSDAPLIVEMMDALADDARFSKLVKKIVASRQFRFRRGGSASSARRPAPKAKED